MKVQIVAAAEKASLLESEAAPVVVELVWR